MEENILRSKVFGRYDSISAFARAIRWDRKKASRIVNGQQLPTSKEIREMTIVLRISSAREFIRVFFPELMPKEEKEGEVHGTAADC